MYEKVFIEICHFRHQQVYREKGMPRFLIPHLGTVEQLLYRKRRSVTTQGN
jgi:hypothetical protein